MVIGRPSLSRKALKRFGERLNHSTQRGMFVGPGDKVRYRVRKGGMPKNKRKRAPKAVPWLPDLRQRKSAPLNSQPSQSFATLV